MPWPTICRKPYVEAAASTARGAVTRSSPARKPSMSMTGISRTACSFRERVRPVGTGWRPLRGEGVQEQLDELAGIGVERHVGVGRLAAPGGDVEDRLADRELAAGLDVGVHPAGGDHGPVD